VDYLIIHGVVKTITLNGLKSELQRAPSALMGKQRVPFAWA